MRLGVYGAKASQDKNFKFANRKERKYPQIPKTRGIKSVKEN